MDTISCGDTTDVVLPSDLSRNSFDWLFSVEFFRTRQSIRSFCFVIELDPKIFVQVDEKPLDACILKVGLDHSISCDVNDLSLSSCS